MALISCPNCEKQISDKATACPHCGEPLTPVTPAPVQSPEPQQPKSNNKKIAIGVGIGLAIALLVAAVVPMIAGNTGKKPQGHIVDDSTGLAVSGQSGYDYYNEPASTSEYYDVTLEVECKQNPEQFGQAADNTYDVEILLDGEQVAILPHGMTGYYDLSLREGNYEVEFRISGKTIFLGNDIYQPTDKDTFKTKTIHVSGDATFSYYVTMNAGNSIQVTEMA